MTEATYAVVFRGEVLDGFSREQVKADFARLFGLNAERLEQLFSQPRAVLKKGLSHAEATRHCNNLRRIGAAVSVEPTTLAPPARPQASPRHARSATAAAAPTPPAPTAAAAVATPAAAPTRTAPRSAQGRPSAARDAGAPPPRPQPARSSAPRELAFEFHGNGFEYFRIWIVNILLTIVTLGIYSAWAKVRTQRYFYGNTQLDGSSFDYLADPVQIFKGRLIAFAALVVYVLAGKLSIMLSVALGFLLFVATPWIIVRGLSFRNNNSTWRGVRFGFDGTYGDAAVAFLALPLLSMLTLGLLTPLTMHRQQRFIAGHSRYGTAQFQFDVGARPFYMAFLVMLGIVVGTALLLAVLKGLVPLLIPLVIAVGYLLLIAFFNVTLANLVYGNLVLEGNRLTSRYELGSFLGLMLVNMLGMALTLGLFYPWAKVRTARYAAEHMTLLACDDLDGFLAARRREVSSVGGEFAEMFDVGVAL